MKRKNILMICYYYPPLTDVGAKRSTAFSKYLKKNGWSPFVLTIKNPDRSYCSLGKDIPPRGIPIEHSYSIVNLHRFLGRLNGLLYKLLILFGIRLRRNYFYDILCVPDCFLGWIPLTLVKAAKTIKRESISILYVSCYPFSSAVIGTLLKKLTRKRLVLDYRDPYALSYLFLRDRTPRFRQKIMRYLDRLFVRAADDLVITSNEFKNLYMHVFPEARGKMHTIHNGFDSEFLPVENTGKYTKFTIIYTGQYFYEDEDTTFFEALSILEKGGKISTDRFQFLFYGDDPARISKIAEAFGVEEFVFSNQRVPYPVVIRAIAKSHLQLLRNRPYAIPVKLFDAIALNVPILAVMPEGEATDIIRKYSLSSYVINEESAERVAEAILDAMEQYERNQIKDNLVAEFLEDFSMEKLALKLMRVIEERLR